MQNLKGIRLHISLRKGAGLVSQLYGFLTHGIAPVWKRTAGVSRVWLGKARHPDGVGKIYHGEKFFGRGCRLSRDRGGGRLPTWEVHGHHTLAPSGKYYPRGKFFGRGFHPRENFLEEGLKSDNRNTRARPLTRKTRVSVEPKT